MYNVERDRDRNSSVTGKVVNDTVSTVTNAVKLPAFAYTVAVAFNFSWCLIDSVHMLIEKVQRVEKKNGRR